jgi:hypothetical protein
MNSQQKIILLAIVFLLGLKVFYVFTASHLEKLPVYLSSFLQDSLLIILHYWLFWGLSKIKCIQKYTKPLFYFLLTVIFAFCIIYTSLILDILTFPNNIFRVDSSMVRFMFEYFVGTKTIVALIFGFGFVVFFSKYLQIKNYRKIFFPIGIIIVVLGLFTVPKSVNPFVYSVVDEIKVALNPHKTTAKIVKLKKPRATNTTQDFRFLEKRFSEIPNVKSKYNKVIVLVMETMNSEMYERAKSDFPLDFTERCQHFSNYYTPNLDSYTALLAMLNAVFVPYQSYTNTDAYAFVNQQHNLVTFFNHNDFFTAFLIPAADHRIRFTPDPDDWDRLVFHNDFDQEGITCVASSRVEMSCEDMVVFDDTMEIVKNNDRVFLFHEMVYGRTAEWFAKTGVTSERYYNEYFNTMVAELQKENIWEETLLIIVADHGPRFNPKNKDDYHIPLLFCADDIESHENDTFYSQIDFKDILLSKITDTESPKETEQIFTLGNSGELIYGKITKDGEYIFIDNAHLEVETNVSDDEVERFHRAYQEYLHYFEYLKP